MDRQLAARRIGIIGGLGLHAGADVRAKMMRAVTVTGAAQCEVLFEQRRFDDDDHAGVEHPNLNGRKLYIFDTISRFERQRVDSVLLPCFISHTFLQELQSELRLPIVNLMDALLAHLRQSVSGPCNVGILTSTYVRRNGLFERSLGGGAYTLLYPREAVQEQCVMPAIYGAAGLQSGRLDGMALVLLRQACADLRAQGADIIIAGATEIAMVAAALRQQGVAVVDSNQAYVDYALVHQPRQDPPAFKLGIIGGVGPAATVDFMDKIIRNTAAGRDQDHIKLIVEHNPKIPDRTANLIGEGEDPTLAIYSACKRLEANDAALIAIPCNTAHAYVARIQPHLSIPIVNMLCETVAHIGHHHGGPRVVGLLATSGTIVSGVYHEAARNGEFELIVPDEAHQELVMAAIYGKFGVKAGYLSGRCREDLLAALRHLVLRGASVVILGCTELPLLLRQQADFAVAGLSVALLDPTEILARRCVSLALGAASLR
jgi:aspartate racemase